jgi:hypothetical protein
LVIFIEICEGADEDHVVLADQPSFAVATVVEHTTVITYAVALAWIAWAGLFI